MDAGVRGKGKPHISEVAKVAERAKHEIPLGSIYPDTSGTPDADDVSQVDIDFSREHWKKHVPKPPAPTHLLPDEEYRQVCASVPILCIDLIIRNNMTGEYLQVKRTNEPLKGEWWVVGGSVRLNETNMEAAANRIANDELGINVFNLHPIGYYTERYAETPHGPKHTLSIVFSCEIAEVQVQHIELDQQSVEFRFDTDLPKRFKQRCNLSHKMFI